MNEPTTSSPAADPEPGAQPDPALAALAATWRRRTDHDARRRQADQDSPEDADAAWHDA